MNIIEKDQKIPDKIGIRKISYCPGDYREADYYSFTFFRNDKTYVECIQPESAEILIDLLEIKRQIIEGYK